MPNQNSLKPFILALLAALGIVLVTLVIAAMLSASGGSSSNGISAYAGGVSAQLTYVLIAGFPVLAAVLFLALRKVFKKRPDRGIPPK